MMIRNLYILILLLFFFGCSVESGKNEFDIVCGYFEELENNSTVNTMTNLQRNDFILNRIIKNLSETSNARNAWEAIGSAEAHQRYILFQSAAESVLNKKWHCDSMERLAHKTGEFE